jgi:hypothetical protein
MITKYGYWGIQCNQDCIHEEIYSGLNSRNACYHSEQSYVFPSPLQKLKDLNIKNYNFTYLYGCETWSHTKRRVQIEGVSEQGAEEKIWT